MPSLRSKPFLMATAVAIAEIVSVGCGGDTSRGQAESSQGNVSTGGAQSSDGVGGAVSDGGQPNGGSGGRASTGGRGGTAGSGGSISEGGTGGMGPPPIPFDVLTLRRGPAAGYCLQPGDILQAGIVYGETGDYGMSGAVFREWDESRPDACWGIESPDCVISEEFDLILTATRVAELAALLAVLPEDRCQLDENMECDPCVLTTLVVDRTAYSNDCCGTQLSAGYDEAFQTVVTFLDGLAPEAG